MAAGAPPPSEEYFGFYHPWGGVLSPRDANLAVATAFKNKGGQVILGKAMPGARAGSKLQTVTLSSGERPSAQGRLCSRWAHGCPRCSPG